MPIQFKQDGPTLSTYPILNFNAFTFRIAIYIWFTSNNIMFLQKGNFCSGFKCLVTFIWFLVN